MDAWYDDYGQRVSAGAPAKAGATRWRRCRRTMCAVQLPLDPETALARRKLEEAGLLPIFNVVVGRQVAHGKPEPDLYLHAADQLGTLATHC